LGSAQWLWAGHFPPDYQGREKSQRIVLLIVYKGLWSGSKALILATTEGVFVHQAISPDFK
jgi:hypothetical protein